MVAIWYNFKCKIQGVWLESGFCPLSILYAEIMSNKITDIVYDMAAPFAESLGLEIVEVEYGKKHDGMSLTIYIVKPDGVSINDCEALHRMLDQPLDDLNPTQDAPYTFNVSSAGLDRPLKTERDYMRHIGKQIEIKLYAPIDGVKQIDGQLIKLEDDTIYIIDNSGKERALPVKSAAKVVQKIIF